MTPKSSGKGLLTWPAYLYVLSTVWFSTCPTWESHVPVTTLLVDYII